jgi:hypothetical protein
MCSRILAIVLSLVFLLSGVVSAGPAIAAPEQHPLAMAADLPAGDSADHDQSGSLLDIPDQLEGPQAPRSIAAQAFRPDAQRTVSLTDPHLAGPQRPPRASALPA